MFTKNYFSFIDNCYFKDNYFNDIFLIDDSTIIFEDNQIIYSESENINKFINHPYRSKFETRDFVSGIEKGLIKDKKYINLILDTNKNYTFVEKNEVYQLSFCTIDNNTYLAYFKVPEIKLCEELNRRELETKLSSRLRIVKDSFTNINLLSEEEIEEKIKNKKKYFLTFIQGLYNQLEGSMPLVDYDVIDKDSNINSNYNYTFINNALCIDKKGNFYKINVTYLESDKYRIEYKYMTIKDLDIERVFDNELSINRTTQKKLLKK